MKNIFVKHKNLIFQGLIFMGFLVALIFLFVALINVNVIYNTNNRIFSKEEISNITDDFDCILILGAGVKMDGSPTPMLRDRLLMGYEVYINNPSIPIVVSGDSENMDYCETKTMQEFLINKSVDKSDIICDGYGLSTYESIWRAKNVYGFNKILIISQKYHLYRAIYIADKLGMVAYGLDSALTDYAKQPLYSVREFFARLKDVIYSELNPNPKYLEKWEEIYE